MQTIWVARAVTVVVLLVALSAAPFRAGAAEVRVSQLDPGFGVVGTTVVPSGEGTPVSGPNNLHAVTIDGTGRVIAVGTDRQRATYAEPAEELAVVVARPDGTLDASFGNGGIVRLSVGANAQGTDVAVQPDGRIVVTANVTAFTSMDGSGMEMVVARLLPDGDLDPSFGSSGIVRRSVGKGTTAERVLVDPVGRLVVAGKAGFDVQVTRLLPDGSNDVTFGTGGTARHSVCCGVVDAALLSDGKILTLTFNGLHGLHADGTLDTTFGTAGHVGYLGQSLGQFEGASALVVQPDGAIVVASRTYRKQMALLRYGGNGTLDATFGESGVTTMVNPSGSNDGHTTAVVRRADGGFVVAGWAVVDGSAHGQMWTVAWLDAQGGIEVMPTDIGFTPDAEARDAVAQPDGKVVVAGYTGNDMALARYQVACTVRGTAGDDVLVGTPGPDTLCGMGGNDVIEGGGGDDMLMGGLGIDLLNGGDGRDTLVGGAGDDALAGDAGADHIDGGPGTDTAMYLASPEGISYGFTVSASGGHATGDTFQTDPGAVVTIENIIGSPFDDWISGDSRPNVFAGGPGNDILFGIGGNDTLAGGPGDDTLHPGNGQDVVYGSLGSDTVAYLVGPAVSIYLNVQQAIGAGHDRFDSIENATGSVLDDAIYGSDAANVLQGDGGTDIIRAGAGDDTLAGGPGIDWLDGGTGADHFDGGDDSAVCVEGGGIDTASGCTTPAPLRY